MKRFAYHKQHIKLYRLIFSELGECSGTDSGGVKQIHLSHIAFEQQPPQRFITYFHGKHLEISIILITVYQTFEMKTRSGRQSICGKLPL